MVLDTEDIKKIFFEEKMKEFFHCNTEQKLSLAQNEWEKFYDASWHGFSFFLGYAKIHFKETRYKEILLILSNLGRCIQKENVCFLSKILNHEMHFYKKLLEAIYLVAKITFEQNRFKESYNLFYILSVLCPTSFDAWLGLGMSYQFLQKPQDAIGAFAKAQLLDASNCITHLYLAEIYLQLNEWDLAKKHGKEGLKLTYKHQKAISNSFHHILNLCEKPIRKKAA